MQQISTYKMKLNDMGREMQRQILEYSDDMAIIRYKEKADKTNTETSKD